MRVYGRPPGCLLVVRPYRGVKLDSVAMFELLGRGMQVILAQVACDLPTQDGCSRHRVSSALYNGLLGQRASYAAVCGDEEEAEGKEEEERDNAISPAQVHS